MAAMDLDNIDPREPSRQEFAELVGSAREAIGLAAGTVTIFDIPKA